MSTNMSNDNTKEEEQVERAYLYIVKIPCSNDVMVCASESKYYPGTYVVVPTRYGLDMGVVLGTAEGLDQGQSPCKRCTGCVGACHFLPTQQGEEPEDSACVSGEIGENGEIYVTMGPLPVFEFRSERPDMIVPDDPEIDETGVWDQAYREPRMVEVDGDVDWISHMATPDELERYAQNIEAEKEVIPICREKVEKRNLNMKLVGAHYVLEEPKLLIFFTAPDRVDFRELVKDLVAVFKLRIEMRQIGNRDEARVLGGLAICGRDFCCHCVSDKLKPVTIKMAKEQNLSLNTTKISGPCGRLMCCLNFEYEYYLEEKQTYPSEGSKIKLGNDFFRIIEVDIFSQKMTVIGPEGWQYLIPRSEVYFNHDKNSWEVSPDYQEEILAN